MQKSAVSTKSGIETEYVPCDLCCSTDHELLFTRTDPITGEDFNLLQCSCGMALVNPMPTEASIPLLYPPEYLHGKELKTVMYGRMLRLLEGAPGKKLLDVGCGRGQFIHYASRQGWKAEGVDLIRWDDPCPVSIRIGDFSTMDLAERSYDAITAWALLEHVRKPSLYFGKVSRLLQNGGRFVFVVPNIAAPGMKTNCSEDIPRHLWLFTEDTVKRYLERVGMEAVSILHNGRIYKAYPFGALSSRLRGRGETRCAVLENKAVALLRNRQVKGNMGAWIADVFRELGPADLIIDSMDLAFGILLAGFSRLIGNYGSMTVIARRVS